MTFQGYCKRIKKKKHSDLQILSNIKEIELEMEQWVVKEELIRTSSLDSIPDLSL